MWSAAPDPARIRRLAEQLLELRPPVPGARVAEPLELACAPEDLVAALGADRRIGSTWLDGGRHGVHRIALDPLLTVATRRGAGVGGVATPKRQVCTRLTAGERGLDVECGGFEVLAALERAHGGGPGRLFGAVGYELGTELERLPAPDRRDVDVPDLWLCLHAGWLEWRSGAWTLVTTGPDSRREWLERLDRASAAIGRTESPPSAVGLPSVQSVRCRPDAGEYVSAVARTVRRIRDGEIFQTNLCRRFEASVDGGIDDGAAWRLYRRMRAVGDAARGAWMVTDRGAILSRSPECFLELEGRRVESRPIKGTRPRGRSVEEDRALREDLATSEKDRAELAMIVDLVRNDLGRVCVTGSVEVAEHARILELPGVWHTVSRVRGSLREDAGGVELLRAAFPAGSITGAPKIQAMVVAAREEPFRRGPAMGAAGWIDPGGDLSLSVAIRTAVVAGGRVVYHAGCGIVADSDPEHEQQESLVKARPFLSALRP